MANKLIHYSCDDIDILDETLDGKNTFDATKMATWQRSQTTDAALQVLQPSTLVVPTGLVELYLVHTTPRTSEPVCTMPVNDS